MAVSFAKHCGRNGGTICLFFMVSFRFNSVSRKRAQLTNSPQMCSDWFLLFSKAASVALLQEFFFFFLLVVDLHFKMAGITLSNDVCVIKM